MFVMDGAQCRGPEERHGSLSRRTRQPLMHWTKASNQVLSKGLAVHHVCNNAGAVFVTLLSFIPT